MKNEMIVTPSGKKAYYVSVNEINELVKTKKLGIPTLQRSSVWNNEQREKFFDGILRKKLLSDIRVYDVTDDTMKITDIPIPYLSSNVMYVDHDGACGYIADGGQRIRTLYICTQSDFNGYTMYIRLTDHSDGVNPLFKMYKGNTPYKKTGKPRQPKDTYISFPVLFDFCADMTLTPLTTAITEIEAFLSPLFDVEEGMHDVIMNVASAFFQAEVLVSRKDNTMEEFYDDFKQCNLNSKKFMKSDNLQHIVLDGAPDLYNKFQQLTIDSWVNLDINDLVWLCYLNNHTDDAHAVNKSKTSEIVMDVDILNNTDVFVKFTTDILTYIEDEIRDIELRRNADSADAPSINALDRFTKTSKYAFAIIQLYYWNNKEKMGYAMEDDVKTFVKWVSATTGFQWSAKYDKMLKFMINHTSNTFYDYDAFITGSEGADMKSVYTEI